MPVFVFFHKPVCFLHFRRKLCFGGIGTNGVRGERVQGLPAE